MFIPKLDGTGGIPPSVPEQLQQIPLLFLRLSETQNSLARPVQTPGWRGLLRVRHGYATPTAQWRFAAKVAE
jgi:hypothetical protein